MRLTSSAACFFCLLWVFFSNGSALAQPASPDDPAGGYVEVTGRVDDSLPDKLRAAKLAACKEALYRVAPVFVEARSTTSFHELVSSYTYAEALGFISEATPVGPPLSEDKVYSQKYRIRVNRGDLNLELWKKKVDIKFLYDAAERPRLCLAISDSDVAVRGATREETVGSSRSHGGIITYFKRQHPGFVFKDLLLMGKSSDSEPDLVGKLVAESAKNSFDILIYGTTRKIATRGLIPPVDYGSVLPPSRSEKVEWEIDWRVIDVRNDETLFYVHTNDIDQAPAELFRQSLVHWNRTAGDRKLEVSFESPEPPDLAFLVRRLKQVEGVDPESVQMAEFEKGKVRYSVAVTRTLPEIISSLGNVFEKDYKIYSGLPGRVRLKSVVSVEVTITVKGASLSILGLVQSKLESSPDVQSVRRQNFSNGVATLVLKTYTSCDEIGSFLEAIPLHSNRLVTTGLTPSAIELEVK
jgi:hypothetical protein